MTTGTAPMSDERDRRSERDPRGRAARSWWEDLQPMRFGRPNPAADRGSLARLRRAAMPSDALDEEAVFALHRKLGFGRARAGETLVPVAVAACVLAGVREHDPTRKPARAVGRSTIGDRDLETAAMSPLRLRRLLEAREPDDVLRQMRRMVRLAGGPLDVGSLATLILDWLDEERGPKARALFAYDYYAAAGDPPGASSEPPTSA